MREPFDNRPRVKIESIEEFLKKQEQEQKKEEPKEPRKGIELKSILTAIPLSVAGLAEFYLVHVITALIVAFIWVILSYVPVLNIISAWFMNKADNTPDGFALAVGAMAAYGVLSMTADRIVKNEEAKKITFMIIGALLVALNIIFLVINLVNHDSCMANLTLILAGITMFFQAKSAK